MRRRRHPWATCAACAIALVFSAQVSADARSDYLINMLENGATYRIRVQAATTLGVIRCADAVPALSRALVDENDLVVISSAAALGQIGSPTPIPALESALKNPPSEPAKAQLETTLRVLRALVDGGDLAPTEAESEPPRFLLRVDAMGDSSGAQREDITGKMRAMVVDRLSRESFVILQSAEMKADQVKAKTKKEKLKAFILSGSIIRLERVDTQLVVKISLNVFSNPGYNLLAMPSAEGSVTVGSGPLSLDAERGAQDRALKAVIDALVGSLLRSLDGMQSR
jgi:hypothetical protein